MEDIWSDRTGEKYLYRHRPAGVYAIDEILKGYVYLTPLDQLNDLNEGRLNFFKAPEATTREEKLSYINHIAQKHQASKFSKNLLHSFLVDPERAWAQVEQLFSETHDYGVGQLKDALADFNIGICCFSKRSLSPTMMAHYGNNQGIVICYDFNALREALESNVLFPVDYVESPATLDQYDLFFNTHSKADEVLEKSLQSAIRSKYIDWEYEKEVRLYSASYAGRELQLPDGAIKGVCLALNTSGQTARVMLEICNMRNIPLYWSSHGDGYEYEAKLCEGIVYEP